MSGYWGQNPRQAVVSGRVAAAAEECGQGRNGALAGNIEPAAEKVPEPHAELGVGLIEAEDCIAAEVAAGSVADLPPSDLAADIVLGHVLIALDGTESFCSGNIHFSQCARRLRSSGKTKVLPLHAGATMVAPGHNHVVAQDRLQPRAGAAVGELEIGT
jgi:hypothetical protein